MAHRTSTPLRRLTRIAASCCPAHPTVSAEGETNRTKKSFVAPILFLILAGTVCPSGRLQAEGEPIAVDGMTVKQISDADTGERTLVGQPSLSALEQRQDIIEYTREQLTQVDPCWGQHEFEDDTVYYLPHEGPEGEGPRAPRVFVSGGCEDEPTPSENGFPNGDDHDTDPPPWASGADEDYWFAQCEDSASPNLWHCWVLQGRPCGAGGEPETTECQPVDARLVYPLQSNGAVVTPRCSEASPTGLCDVLVGTFNTHTDFGPDAFEVWRDDWRQCAENPQLCPEGHTILLDCISFPHLCEFEIDLASFEGPQADQEQEQEVPIENCNDCFSEHATKLVAIGELCESVTNQNCGLDWPLVTECTVDTFRTVCAPIYELEEESFAVCSGDCMFFQN